MNPVPTSAYQGEGVNRPQGHVKLLRFLRACDLNGHVAIIWEAREVRKLYAHDEPDPTVEWVTKLGRDLQDKDYPIEARSLGRTFVRWRHRIAAWHTAHVTNSPCEVVNKLERAGQSPRLQFHVLPELPDQCAALRR